MLSGLLLLLLLLAHVCLVSGYSKGPPDTVCSSMLPGHGGSSSTSTGEYTVTFPPGQTTYSEDERIQVTLQGTDSNTFKGFLIEARTNVSSGTLYGSILTEPSETRWACGNQKAALSHSSSTARSSVTFEWQAPSSGVGNIVFVYTVVQSKPIYWVKLQSTPLTFRSSKTTTTVATQTPTTQTDVQTNDPQQTSTQTHSKGTKTDPSTITPITKEPSTNDTTAETTSQNVEPSNATTPQQTTTQTDATGTSTNPSITTTSATTTTTKPPTNVLRKDVGCDDTVGCFHDCDPSDSCGFLLTWKDIGDEIDLTLTCKRTGSNSYCAIGLSYDDKMGDDSVFECVATDDQPNVYVSYNDGRSNVRLAQPQFGITVKSTSYQDGKLQCVFTRKKTAALATTAAGRRNRDVTPSSSNFFDMNMDYNLFYAYGSSGGGIIYQHDVIPIISTQKVDFQSFADHGAQAAARSLTQVHGIFMTVAWVCLAALGMFTARNYKDTWPEEMEWFGQKRWFVIHRTCMVLTFLLTVASFVIIFEHVGGYAEIQGTSFEKSHPILGIVVTALAVINPVMAIFRPHPGTKYRPYFNFAHIFVGRSAQICAYVNLFSGILLLNAPFYLMVILWCMFGWIVVIEVAVTVFNGEGSESKRSEAYELKNPMDQYSGRSKSQGMPSFKVTALILHAVILLVVAIAVSVVIAMGEMEPKDDENM